MTNTYTIAPQPAPSRKEVGLASLTLDPIPPLAITPVIHPRDGVADPKSRTFWSAVANAVYIVRREGHDLFGPTPSVAAKLAQGNDLIEHGRRGPIGCEADAVSGLRLWEAADRAATGDQPSAPAAHHLIGFVPPELDLPAWREIVFSFLQKQVVAQGMIADWAIHALPDGTGGWIKKPHFHAVVAHRFWKANERKGEPNEPWIGTSGSRKRLIDAWAELSHAARLQSVTIH